MADLTADKGETVTLTYQVYNLGDQSGDQTVTLSVDGTQVDSDSNVQVGSLARSTATLEWDTSNADKGDHTLEVGSDNDSETITVNVGDVQTGEAYSHIWLHDEGSGSTLNDTGESATTLDGTLNGPAWATGAGTNNTYLEYTRSNDDYVQLPSDAKSELSHFANTGEGSLFVWVKPIDFSTGRGCVIGSEVDDGNIDFDLRIKTDQSVGWFWHNSATTGGIVAVSSSADSAPANEWTSIGVRQDGSTAYLYIDGTQVATASVSTESGDIDRRVQFGIDRNVSSLNSDASYGGGIGQAYIDKTDIGDQNMKALHNDTKGYYS